MQLFLKILMMVSLKKIKSKIDILSPQLVSLENQNN